MQRVKSYRGIRYQKNLQLCGNNALNVLD